MLTWSKEDLITAILVVITVVFWLLSLPVAP